MRCEVCGKEIKNRFHKVYLREINSYAFICHNCLDVEKVVRYKIKDGITNNIKGCYTPNLKFIQYEDEQDYHILQVNNTIQKIKNRIIKFLCEVSYNSELTDILSYQNIDNLRTLCNNVYVIYKKDRKFEIQLINENYTVVATIYLKVKNNGKYTLKWTIEEQNGLTDIIKTQQENTTLISCIVLLKTLLERKGLKYSNENS